ncbi:MAG: OadG family protein [Prevotella sp.]|nr:OadG family protein [Bacteroides sp.]MCM1365823.1 OadG family protein [Prevotella sp.]MCM1436485.1 OadG family protein [Prevotella sp.]
MIKRLLAAGALSIALCFGSTAYASAVIPEGEQLTIVDSNSDGQTTVTGEWDNTSTETNTITESATAKKMTQAEKAHNAEVNDSWGGGITIIAMCVVIAALVILSILFLCFGKISSKIMSRKKLAAQGLTKEDATDHHKDVDSGEVIAAIATALAQHFNTNGHDMEDTILTIRRMKRAYSPWNSKIYNMREVPELKRNRR